MTDWQQLDADATPGPWHGRGIATCWCLGWCNDPLHRDGRCYGAEILSEELGHRISSARGHDDRRAVADAEFIATARTAWPAAERRAAQLEALLQEVRDAVEFVYDEDGTRVANLIDRSGLLREQQQ
jgi:hypothetical protein